MQSFAYQEKTDHEQDSSMVVVKKSISQKPLEILWYLITTVRYHHKFSWGDKESFWIAYELAHQDYFFSPWAMAAVASSSHEDMKKHPDTLCGSMAHYLPVEEANATLLYVNGKALLDPYPGGVSKYRRMRIHQLYNVNPTHVSPRQKRRERKKSTDKETQFKECLVGQGSTPLPSEFKKVLLRRRMYYFAIRTDYLPPLELCEV